MAYQKKYNSAEERRAALSAKAKEQMTRQWSEVREAQGKDGPSYYGCHRRVRTARGSASLYECIECGETAKDWAQVHGTTGYDAEHYQPMCRKCHFAYDGVGAKVVAAKGPDGLRAAALKAWATKKRATT